MEETGGFYNFHYPLEDFLMCNINNSLHRFLLSSHILSIKAPAFFIEQLFELWHADTKSTKEEVFDRMNLDISALLNRFAYESLYIPSDNQQIKSQKEMPNMQLFSQILHYIFEHFQEDIRNQDLADYLGYHENYIQRVFKGFSGYSIRQFIIHIRLKYACSLLRNTKRSIFNIAIETGFGSISRFYKAFGDCYNLSPKQYRKLNHM